MQNEENTMTEAPKKVSFEELEAAAEKMFFSRIIDEVEGDEQQEGGAA